MRQPRRLDLLQTDLALPTPPLAPPTTRPLHLFMRRLRISPIAVLSGAIRAGSGTAQGDSVPTSDFAVAAEAGAEAGDHIVLGLTNFGLEDTAAKAGRRTLLQDTEWQAMLQKTIGDPSMKFTVSVHGMSGGSTYSQVIGAATRGAAGTGGYTDWEMAQLFRWRPLARRPPSYAADP